MKACYWPLSVLLVMIQRSDLLFHSYKHRSISLMLLVKSNHGRHTHSAFNKRNSKSFAFKSFEQRLTRLFSTRREGLGKPKGYAGHQQQYKLERQTLSGLPIDIDIKPFLVLGIESSCDDTGVAIVRSDGEVLANALYSQYDIHSRFGGIVPGLAMEAHKINIDKAIDEALVKAGLNSVNDVDAIAVTKGPGLEICLRIGKWIKNTLCLTIYILLYLQYVSEDIT